jgi:hypothetical protein
VRDAIVFHDRHHYLITHKKATERREYQLFREWLIGEVKEMMASWRETGEEHTAF